ncbi:MAG: acireductone synthase [Bacteroidota bacterium]
MSKAIKFILTDIEGTTTSISFVTDILFPYFRKNIAKLKDMTENPEVFQAFEETIDLAKEIEGKELKQTDEIIETLLKWSLKDKKITPLKTLQGILWEDAYKSGEVKGHIYEDVPQAFKTWKENGIDLGIFSSGSVPAQKLLFTYSDFGDLSPNFTAYFDTKTGGKRETETYTKISQNLNISPENILFLSDIVEELEAAKSAGFQTIQLVREGNTASWENHVSSFSEIEVLTS